MAQQTAVYSVNAARATSQQDTLGHIYGSQPVIIDSASAPPATTMQSGATANGEKDLNFVRLVLKYAKNIEKHISDLPDFPSFRGEAWELAPTRGRSHSRTVGEAAQARQGPHRR